MPRWPYRVWVLGVVLGGLLIGSIGPTSWFDTMLQHVPTLTAIALLVFFGTGRPGTARAPMSNRAYTLLGVFFMLHILGAHYLYSNVPYDVWAKRVIGTSISDVFGFSRNHYDRLVHFSFGLLIAPVVHELATRHEAVRSVFGAFLLSIGVVSIFGNVYEMIEWLVAVTLPGETAENYNGQQGDMFDAQKDLALSFTGSCLGLLLLRRR